MSITPRGGLPFGFVTIYGSAIQSGAQVLFGDVPASPFSTNPTVMSVAVPVHEAGTVDVTVVNPGGQTVALSQAFTYRSVAVTPGETTVEPGASIRVAWSNPVDYYNGCFADRLGLYRVGDANDQPVSHLDVWTAEGVENVTAPAHGGEYEFRFLIGNNAYVAGRSAIVVVGSPSR